MTPGVNFGKNPSPERLRRRVDQMKAKSEIPDLRRLELKLQFVRNQGDELTIGGFSLGIGHGIAEEPLQGIQIAPVPCHFDGVADGTLDAGRRGLEGFRHLRVQYLRDGVDDR